MLMFGSHGFVMALCGGNLRLRRCVTGLIEVVWVNFLLTVGLHQENGKDPDCER
jgi:hypothetical protein